jgi:cyclomaltodextrinase / maltogenic alpha-amylase / neopullulanase
MKLIQIIMIGLIAMASPYSQTQELKLSLDGVWLFQSDPHKIGIKESWFTESFYHTNWVKMVVPDFWENHEHFKNYDGWGWYARTFQFKKTSDPMSIFFAGVDDDAVVWINGIEVGTHTGYSDPFDLDITNSLRDGENFIVVQVLDYGGGGGIYQPVSIIETKNIDTLKKSKYFGQLAISSADWVKDAVIYSAYLRSASEEGTFKGLEKRIPELKEMGITVIWLLPIHPIGVKNRKGSLGSPYSVQDFYGINPEFGTMEDFKSLLNAAHDNGMKLIIDLVANHTSWDSKLILEHPDWFTKDEKGNFVPPVADWSDVADLDYSKSDLRKYMIAMMKWWVKDIGIDGFRCDVAELVPTDFWEEARDTLNTIKSVMMLSEGSLPEHHLKAFDLTYSWNLYDILEPLLKGKRSPQAIDQLLKNEYLQFPIGSLRMRFNTNHDKNAWESSAVNKYGVDRLKLTAVLINTIPGVPMIYTGEEVANNKKLSLFEKTEIDWSRSDDMKKLYSKLSTLRNKHKAFSRGDITRIEIPERPQVYAFLRTYSGDTELVILNFSGKETDVEIDLSGKLSPLDVKGNFLPMLFSRFSKLIKFENGKIELNLEPYGFFIFTGLSH